MRTHSKEFFETLEKEFKYLDRLVSIQSEPYRYNWLKIPIENNINSIQKWVKENAEYYSPNMISQAFFIYRKYLLLLEKFYLNNHIGLN